jgi:hypothetical protein
MLFDKIRGRLCEKDKKGKATEGAEAVAEGLVRKIAH